MAWNLDFVWCFVASVFGGCTYFDCFSFCLICYWHFIWFNCWFCWFSCYFCIWVGGVTVLLVLGMVLLLLFGFFWLGVVIVLLFRLCEYICPLAIDVMSVIWVCGSVGWVIWWFMVVVGCCLWIYECLLFKVYLFMLDLGYWIVFGCCDFFVLFSWVWYLYLCLGLFCADVVVWVVVIWVLWEFDVLLGFIRSFWVWCLVLCFCFLPAQSWVYWFCCFPWVVVLRWFWWFWCFHAGNAMFGLYKIEISWFCWSGLILLI